jgi:hypothetical protein
MVVAEDEELTPLQKAYFKDLHRLIDSIYKEAADQHEWTWNKLAGVSGLSSITVNNLGNRHTRYPQFLTVYKLAKAVGWVISLDSRQKIKLAKAG